MGLLLLVSITVTYPCIKVFLVIVFFSAVSRNTEALGVAVVFPIRCFKFRKLP